MCIIKKKRQILYLFNRKNGKDIYKKRANIISL